MSPSKPGCNSHIVRVRRFIVEHNRTETCCFDGSRLIRKDREYTCFKASIHQHFSSCVMILATYYCIRTFYDYCGLLGGDFFDGVAQNVLMIEIDRSNNRDNPVHCVRGIETPS